MNNDEIIEMARPAEWLGNVEGWTFNTYQQLEAFAKLVAAKEREACAKVCDDSQSPPDWNSVAVLWKECKNKLAEAIRARGDA